MQSTSAVGFLTAVEDEAGTVFGGFLILNAFGRPLEFHCTAPVTPTRAQQILYGPTLKPFLYGEYLGGALLAKAQMRPALVCTDQPATLAAQHVTDLPVVLVAASTLQEEAIGEAHFPTEANRHGSVSCNHTCGTMPEWPTMRSAGSLPNMLAEKTAAIQSAGATLPKRATGSAARMPLLARFSVGGYDLAVHGKYPAMQAQVTEPLEQLCETMDLVEPFQRIREAIAEARRAA